MIPAKSTIYSLELLRFLLATLVFFGHYVHFYMHYAIPEDEGYFYKINPTFGSIVVPMFFLMSGAIFAHTYLNKIRNGSINLSRYALNRFARLYPLHLMTLIAVAILQIIFFELNDVYFIYKFNDVKHFLLNVLFASNWGLEDGLGFNAPVWSVSHEVFIYLIFFVVCTFSAVIESKLLFFAAWVVFIGFIEASIRNPLVPSAFCFFLGTLLYLAFNYCLLAKSTKMMVFRILIFVSIMMIFSSYFSKHGLPYGAVGPFVLIGCLLFDQIFHPEPGSIFCKIAVFLGNISYSTYLLHFPIQLLFVIICEKYIKIDFSDARVLGFYVFAVMLVATFSYKFFENPIRLYLKSKY